MDKEQMTKGFLKAIKNWGDIQANEQKLKASVLANEFEKKQNWFYKMQERKQENQMTQDLMKNLSGMGGGTSSEGGGNTIEEFNRPTLRVGTGGKAEVHYPSAGEQKLAIEFRQKRIQQKEAKNIPLDEKDMKFKEEYSIGASSSSPLLEKVKNSKIETIMNTIEQSNIKREIISDATQAATKIQGGVYGKLSRWAMRNLDPNNPALGEWQKVKMVLTDAQLLNTAKTKGAISDREMDLFARAAANDDIASLPAIMPVLKKVFNMLNADESSMVNSFKKVYNENPYDWEGVKSNISEVALDNNKSTAGDTLINSKIKRANEIAQSNPNLTKQQIIDMVNKEIQ